VKEQVRKRRPSRQRPKSVPEKFQKILETSRYRPAARKVCAGAMTRRNECKEKNERERVQRVQSRNGERCR